MAKMLLAACAERAIIRLIEVNLARSRYRVLIAADRASAMDLARAHHPDGILIDASMADLKDVLAADPATRDIPVRLLPPSPRCW